MIEPKLAMIPSAVKLISSPYNAKVYSVLPNDGTGDFTGGNIGFTPTAKYNENLLVEFGLEPRLDWYSNQNCPTLLMEAERTNTLFYSSQFDTYWAQQDITLLGNIIISPDGLKNAWKITSNSSNGSGRLSQSVFRNTYAQTYENYSIFVKRGENGGVSDALQLQLNTPNQANINITEFDFDTKEITQLLTSGIYLDESRVRELPNDWYRLEMRYTMDLSYQTIFSILPANNTNVFIWGTQREQTGAIGNGLGVMPSSYIPTSGASSVTRGFDFFNSAGDSLLFDNLEGSLFFDFEEIFDQFLAPSNPRSVSIVNTGDIQNRITIEVYPDGFVFFQYRTTLGTFSALSILINKKQRNKFALSWNQNTFKVSHNGTMKSEDSHNLGLPIALNSLNLDDGNPFASSKFYGEINDIRYYDKLLSNTDLTQLTAI
tara:strand:+ start:121 stop:1413 length:1293 start_codon:yes stop_codon:yes gene_type:complete